MSYIKMYRTNYISKYIPPSTTPWYRLVRGFFSNTFRKLQIAKLRREASLEARKSGLDLANYVSRRQYTLQDIQNNLIAFLDVKYYFQSLTNYFKQYRQHPEWRVCLPLHLPPSPPPIRISM